jgi:hypothetical protein
MPNARPANPLRPSTPAGSGRASKEQSTIKGWFKAGASGQSATGKARAPALGKLQKRGCKNTNDVGGGDSLFEPIALTEETILSLRANLNSGGKGGFSTGQDEDAAASSAAGGGEGDEAAMLAQEIEVSRAAAGATEEDWLMKEALEASVRDARRVEEEESALLVCGNMAHDT